MREPTVGEGARLWVVVGVRLLLLLLLIGRLLEPVLSLLGGLSAVLSKGEAGDVDEGDGGVVEILIEILLFVVVVVVVVGGVMMMGNVGEGAE